MIKKIIPDRHLCLCKTAVSILLLGLLSLASCRKKHHTVTRGFYYWKTGFALSDYEQQRLKDVGCKRIFIRCFDVDWDVAARKPKPVATLRIGAKPSGAFSYVPVVFITQQTIARLGPQQVPELAENIAGLLASTCSQLGIQPKEIQIDCDWTQRTKDAYFHLLETLKRATFFKGKLLSCTIRLHQVKYQLRSGIPPVDRGLIMCYNVGNLKQPGAHNSILDASLTEDYLQDVGTYPLPVDVALPLYSWCLHFRNGKMLGILRDVTPEAVSGNALFTLVKDHLYQSNADTIWQGYHLQKGDELRVESPEQEALEHLAHFTANAIRNDTLSVLFFHIDSLTLAKYSVHDLEAVYNAYP